MNQSDDRPLIELAGVTKGFGNEIILDQLNLQIYPGRHLIIEGPSGCGKSTLLRCLALLEPIQGGEIRYRGRTVATPRKRIIPDKQTRTAISMVFQQLFLWPHLSVFENVAMPLKLLGNPTLVAEARSELMLKRFGIDHKRDEYPNSLSGGQQQRVALARAFVHAPRLFLLDEITANLDDRNIQIVMEMVAAICKMGTTVVMVTHHGLVPSGIEFARLSCRSGAWHSGAQACSMTTRETLTGSQPSMSIKPIFDQSLE